MDLKIARSGSPWKTGLRHAWFVSHAILNTGATKPDIVVAVVRVVVVADRATAVLCCIDPRAATQNRPLDDPIPIIMKLSVETPPKTGSPVLNHNCRHASHGRASYGWSAEYPADRCFHPYTVGP